MAGFEDMVGAIRQAGEDDEAWPRLLVRLADYLGGVEVTLGGADAAGANPQML